MFPLHSLSESPPTHPRWSPPPFLDQISDLPLGAPRGLGPTPESPYEVSNPPPPRAPTNAPKVPHLKALGEQLVSSLGPVLVLVRVGPVPHQKLQGLKQRQDNSLQ